MERLTIAAICAISFLGCIGCRDVASRFNIKKNAQVDACWEPICSMPRHIKDLFSSGASCAEPCQPSPSARHERKREVDIFSPYDPLQVDYWTFESKEQDKCIRYYCQNYELFVVVGRFSSTAITHQVSTKLRHHVDTILVKNSHVILVDELEELDDRTILDVTRWVEQKFDAGEIQ